jgi:hypothetical protein
MKKAAFIRATAIAALALAGLLAAPDQASACSGRGCYSYSYCYTPCYYTPCYYTPCYPPAIADGCYVYRWEPYCCAYVFDKSFTDPDPMKDERDAKMEIKTLLDKGIFAYAICYKTVYCKYDGGKIVPAKKGDAGAWAVQESKNVLYP